jgi:hypothetical protein
MNNFESRKWASGLVETALLRNHVRELLLKGDASPPQQWYADWHRRAMELFNRHGWFDLELRNAAIELEPLGTDVPQS